MDTDRSSNWKLSFRLRDLLWLTAVIALALGWWLDHRQLQAIVDGMAIVSGTVKLDGYPLPKGQILFVTKDGNSVGGPIRGGDYRLSSVPLGRYTVQITGAGVPAMDQSWLVTDAKPHFNEFHIELASDQAFERRAAAPPPP